MKKIIGTNTIGYPEIRNFAGFSFDKYEIKKIQNLHKIPAYVYFKLTKKTHPYFWNSYRDFDLQNAELFHFFNALSYGKKPWISTFETSLPRWGGKNVEAGLKLIAGESCKKIIAMSNCTANIQQMFVSDNFPEFRSIIDEKLMVLHPPQKCPPIEEIKKDISGKLIFTIIGSDFFRKGGKETLIAFDRLYERGIKDWHLNIVSKMQYGDYASKATIKDLEYVYRIIAKYPNNITHQKHIPNHEVLNLFKSTHVGLLPTYADTYGYSVLEAQSFGCPVISTNIRALPEINNTEIGWVIPVKKNESGNAILNTEKDIENFSQKLANELEATLLDIFNNTDEIILKGMKSYKKLENSIDRNREILENLYDEITTYNNA